MSEDEEVVITKMGSRYTVGCWASPTRFINYWFDAVDELDAYRKYLAYKQYLTNEDEEST
jgi:hypothetical protein